MELISREKLKVPGCVFWLTVTPELAEWLFTTMNRNRPFRQRYAEELLWKMRVGLFFEQRSMLAFDSEGWMVDGQHRVWAIWQSGKTYRMLAQTGLSPAEVAVLDTGKSRTAADAFDLSGNGDLLAGTAKNTLAGMWRVMMSGRTNQSGVSNDRLIRFANANREAGTWAADQFRKWPRIRFVTIAPVMGAVARAFYHYQGDLDHLARFVEVVTTGVGQRPEDATPQAFKTCLSQLTGRNSNFSGDIYGKTCSAIRAYMERRVIVKFQIPTDDLFPLPAEKSADVVAPTHRVSRIGGRPEPRRPRADQVPEIHQPAQLPKLM